MSKNGVAVKELERQLGVTYKCAWRIAKSVCMLFLEGRSDPFYETYASGRRKSKRGADGKTAVLDEDNLGFLISRTLHIHLHLVFAVLIFLSSYSKTCEDYYCLR